jgi:hypothetical protein
MDANSPPPDASIKIMSETSGATSKPIFENNSINLSLGLNPLFL